MSEPALVAPTLMQGVSLLPSHPPRKGAPSAVPTGLSGVFIGMLGGYIAGVLGRVD